MLDRGWRRSGTYCYKNLLNRTCCPTYTIRCDAMNFKPSQSQKKVMKRFTKFLTTGSTKMDNKTSLNETPLPDEYEPQEYVAVENITKALKEVSAVTEVVAPKTTFVSQNNDVIEDVSVQKPTRIKEKSLEDFLYPRMTNTIVHKFTTRLIRVHPPDDAFKETFDESFALYRKYQIAVHGDSPSDLTVGQYRRFLCESPLIYVGGFDSNEATGQNHPGFGSFHQHYLLDGRLIAVGVIDILPNCISSKYFYYDVDYRFLTLGVYSALREIAFVRSLAKTTPSLRFYYMGFYIHSCQKMRYKGKYHPSYLLCPETYTWHLIEECTPKLDVNKYCRFLPDPQEVPPPVPIKNVMIFYCRIAMSYVQYQKQRAKSKSLSLEFVKCDDEEIGEFAQLVGGDVLEDTLLYRHYG